MLKNQYLIEIIEYNINIIRNINIGTWFEVSKN